MGTGYSFPELGSTVSSFQELGGEVACENSYWMVDGLAGEMAIEPVERAFYNTSLVYEIITDRKQGIRIDKGLGK